MPGAGLPVAGLERVRREFSVMDTEEGLRFEVFPKDPVYSRPDTHDGKVGVTWLSRWAAGIGIKGNYGSTQVPEFIGKIASGKN